MCINNAHFCCSWHEIGYYDLPAMIDYVLKTTGHSQLYYIGHSQGTTAFYVMGSERPEYNAKVKIMISLAPIAFLSNQRSPLLKFIVHFNSLMEVILLQSHFLALSSSFDIYYLPWKCSSGDLIFVIYMNGFLVPSGRHV